MNRKNKAEKRKEIANKILAEWNARGFTPEQGDIDTFWKEMEAFATKLVEEAYAMGYTFSKSQWNPIWNSAMTCTWDAYVVVRNKWEASVMSQILNIKEAA